MFIYTTDYRMDPSECYGIWDASVCQQVTTQLYSLDPNEWYECDCWQEYSYWKGWSHCTTHNGCASGYDKVAKERTCYDPGSCANTALGFQGCY